MGIPNLQSAATTFRPSDLLQSQANQALGRLNPQVEFQLATQPQETAQSVGALNSESKPEGEDLRKAFQDFIGQTLFSQMISSMRSTQDGAAYFDGGRAEKIFQGQLDQILSEELSEASASKISDPMFKLFQLRRQ